MMTDFNWLYKKWGFSNQKSLDDRIQELEKVVFELQEKYSGALQDIKRLEEENIETTNVLYELGNSIDAVDTRIDILTAEKWVNKNV
jgi:chromosome segregation ATPase